MNGDTLIVRRCKKTGEYNVEVPGRLTEDTVVASGISTRRDAKQIRRDALDTRSMRGD
jgi:hypothetical protein